MEEKNPVARTDEEREETVELADEQLEDATGGVMMYPVGACRAGQYCPRCKENTVFMCDHPTKAVDRYWGTIVYETGWHCTKCWYQSTWTTYGKVGE